LCAITWWSAIGRPKARRFACVLDRLVEDLLRGTDRTGRARQSFVLQLPHQVREPLAGLGADQVAVRHDDVVERDLGRCHSRASRAC